MADNIWDVNVSDYPRLEGETSDDKRIMRAAADCEGGVLYLGKGLYEIAENARLIGCSYYNNYTYKMDDVTVIDHRGGQLLVSGCMFRKHSPNATIYKGDRSGLVTSDNLLEGFDNDTF